MKALAEQTHYEVLEVEPGAPLEVIRAGYERLRRLLGPDSLAVYSLVAPAEHEALLLRLDEAWAVLSDPASRRSYDASLGLVSPEPAPAPRPSFAEAVAAIQKASSAPGLAASAPAPAHLSSSAEAAPPVSPAEAEEEPPEIVLDDDDLLEVVEIGGGERAGIRIARIPDPALETAPEPFGAVEESLLAEEAAAAPDAPLLAEPEAEAEALLEGAALDEAVPEEAAVEEAVLDADVAEEAIIEEATVVEVAVPEVRAASEEEPVPPDAVFTGELLRRLRVARGVSLEEISRRTRIAQAHLENIEADRWSELPTRVFLRGYLTAYARELRLDAARVCETYLARREKGANR